MAKTQSPTRILSESPNLTAFKGRFVSILIRARSVLGSLPMTLASVLVSSERVMLMLSALVNHVVVSDDVAVSVYDKTGTERFRQGRVPLSPFSVSL